MSQHNPPTTERYGPASFIAAVTTMAVVQTATWVWLPYWMLNVLIFGVVSVPVLMTGLFFSQVPGPTGQVGRGVLIGYLATLLTIAITAVSAAGIYFLRELLR